jgi:hypothetical protein
MYGNTEPTVPVFLNTENQAPSSKNKNFNTINYRYMNKKILIVMIVMSMVAIYVSSCYNNKADIPALPKVSFLGEVVPIVTSGACGCHNNVNANTATGNAVPFSKPDTLVSGVIMKRVETGAIVARVDTMAMWANGQIGHPGGGVIDFTPNQKLIIKAWKAQGQPYDGGSVVCDLNTTIKHSTHIQPIYLSTCKSAGCHGGRGPVLDYNKMVADKNILGAMMNSGGSTGHPGGTIGMTSCTIDTFKKWMADGMLQ